MASLQIAFLMAALTKMRSTSGCRAAARMRAKCCGVQACGSTSRPSGLTTLVAVMNSRSARDSAWSGMGDSQMSASRPIWWDACPLSMGPPRGCDTSPTRMPGQPLTAGTCVAKRSRKAIRAGLPQLRLRDTRITCQAGPLIGRASAPARQPRA